VGLATNKVVDISYVPFPKDTSYIERRSFIANNSKFSAKTGWSATIALREGIKNTISHFRNKIDKQ